MFFNKKTNKQRWIIVGLGNVGPEYEGTRHNCGFAVVDLLAEKYSIDIRKRKLMGTLGEGSIEGTDVVLVKPVTYMNRSGQCVRQVLDWYKQGENRLLVIYDDIDIQLGAVRVRARGSAGSHNGLKSVLEYTDTDMFVRVRVGIGKNPAYMDLADYVLGRFTKEQEAGIHSGVQKAAEAVASVLKEGCERTMNFYNSGGNKWTV